MERLWGEDRLSVLEDLKSFQHGCRQVDLLGTRASSLGQRSSVEKRTFLTRNFQIQQGTCRSFWPSSFRLLSSTLFVLYELNLIKYITSTSFFQVSRTVELVELGANQVPSWLFYIFRIICDILTWWGSWKVKSQASNTYRINSVVTMIFKFQCEC